MASIAAMRKTLPLILALVLGAGSAFALVACGDGGTDPSVAKGDAQELLAELDQIQANYEVESCLVAASHAESLLTKVEALPSSVDSDLKTALENGTKQLTVLLSDPANCGQTTTTETTTPTESTTTTEPTEPTTTEETTTEPTTTEPTTTTDTGTAGGGVGVPEG